MTNTLITDAVSSARNLDWQKSACTDPRLHVPFTPAEVYNANVALTMGNIMWVAPDARKKIADFLSGAGRGEVAESLLQDRPITKLALSEFEMEALKELQNHVGFNKMKAARMLEESVAMDGYGVPAIAVLVLLVAVAIAVWLVLASVP
jgi:hypothetical protein